MENFLGGREEADLLRIRCNKQDFWRHSRTTAWASQGCNDGARTRREDGLDEGPLRRGFAAGRAFSLSGVFDLPYIAAAESLHFLPDGFNRPQHDRGIQEYGAQNGAENPEDIFKQEQAE